MDLLVPLRYEPLDFRLIASFMASEYPYYDSSESDFGKQKQNNLSSYSGKTRTKKPKKPTKTQEISMKFGSVQFLMAVAITKKNVLDVMIADIMLCGPSVIALVVQIIDKVRVMLVTEPRMSRCG